MLELFLKDLQEEVITSEIQKVQNEYTFDVMNIGRVSVVDNGVIVDVKVTIDNQKRTYPVTRKQMFDLLPQLAHGVEPEVEFEEDDVEEKEESIFLSL